jgi:hypothetical protein
MNGCDKLGSLLSEVALPHDAVLVDHKRHDTARAVGVGVRKQREACLELSTDHIVTRATSRSGSLRIQGPVEVAVIGRGSGRSSLPSIPTPRCSGQEGAGRALRLARRDLPVEPVVLSGRAPDQLRVDTVRVSIVPHRGVLLLSLDVPPHHVDGAQLVGADATQQDLVHRQGPPPQARRAQQRRPLVRRLAAPASICTPQRGSRRRPFLSVMRATTPRFATRSASRS